VCTLPPPLYYQKKPAAGNSAYRGISKKRLSLAKFVSELPDDMSDQEKMNSWNRQFPEWNFKYLSEFKRRAKEARERLLRPGFLK
jgi:hypothetical protein